MVTGGIYLYGYIPNRRHAEHLATATPWDGTSGWHYATGTLNSTKRMELRGSFYHAILTKKYARYYALTANKQWVSADTQDQLVGKTMDSNGVYLLNRSVKIPIDNLLPILMSTYGKKIEDLIEPVDNSFLGSLGSFSLTSDQTQGTKTSDFSIKHQSLTGYHYVKYGLKDDTTIYTIVGPTNGIVFCDSPDVVVGSNTSIEELRETAQYNVTYYGWWVGTLGGITVGLGLMDYWFNK